jgi:hypothetical protein
MFTVILFIIAGKREVAVADFGGNGSDTANLPAACRTRKQLYVTSGLSQPKHVDHFRDSPCRAANIGCSRILCGSLWNVEGLPKAGRSQYWPPHKAGVEEQRLL